MQVGRQVRRSLIRPPAQRRANIKCRPGCSGLCSDRSCKTPRTEFPQCLWEASSTPNCPQRENCFLICSLYFPCSNLRSLFIILLPSTYVSTFLISLLILEIRLMLGCSQNPFSKPNGSRCLSLPLQVIYSCSPATLVPFPLRIHSNLSTRGSKTSCCVSDPVL